MATLSTAYNKNLWMLSEGSAELAETRCLGDAHTATIAELLITLLGIDSKKAEQVTTRLCGQSNLLDKAMAWQRLRQCTPVEMQHAGLTKKQAAKLAAAMELGRRAYTEKVETPAVVDDPVALASILGTDLFFQSVERFAVVALDIRHKIIAVEVFNQGTQSETLVDMRSIFGWLMRVGACRFAIAHNHPSGNLEPSPEDLGLTRQFLQSSQLLQLALLDHLIMGKGEYRSLRQTTSLWNEVPQGA